MKAKPLTNATALRTAIDALATLGSIYRRIDLDDGHNVTKARQITPAVKRAWRKAYEAVSLLRHPLFELRFRAMVRDAQAVDDAGEDFDYSVIFTDPARLPTEIDEEVYELCARAIQLLADIGHDRVEDDKARAELKIIAADLARIFERLQPNAPHVGAMPKREVVVVNSELPLTDAAIRRGRVRAAFMQSGGNANEAMRLLAEDGVSIKKTAFYNHVNVLMESDGEFRQWTSVSALPGNPESHGLTRKHGKSRGK